MKFLVKLLVTVALTITSHKVSADHLVGGEITWRCTSNGSFVFTLVLYGDCNGALALFGTTSSINSNSPAGNIAVTLISETDVSPQCYDASQEITCQNAINSTSYINGAVKKYVYESAPVSMNGVPPVSGWEFSWGSCCRPFGVQNIISPGSASYYLRAKMFPYTPPGATSPANVSTCYDSSPSFGENGSPTICTGYKFTYNHLAIDSDLDSIAFHTADPLTGSNQVVNWSSGFNSANPFPDASEDVANGPFSLDPVSGEMTTEVYGFGSSASDGFYASCIKIEAWRDCQLIAEVYRDVAISMLSGCAINTQPSAEIDTSTWKGVQRLSSNVYYARRYPGDIIEFEILAQDFEFNGTLPQEITFTAAGLQVSNPLTSGTGCLGAGSCAKFTPVAPQIGFSRSLQNRVKFEWTPQCVHLGASGSCGSVTSTYYFTLKMRDDGCPAPAVSISTLIVDVVPGDPEPPGFTSIFQQPNGDIDCYWNEADIDSALSFNYYRLYGAQNINGPYTVLDSIVPKDSLTTTVPLGGGYLHFYMEKSTGACDFISTPSDTLSLIQLSMIATPPSPNSEIANLEWSALHSPLLSSSKRFYEIWKRTTTSQWIFVDSIPELSGAPSNYLYTYSDTSRICDDTLYYQIRVIDTINGWTSGSTYVNGRFSDKTNNSISAIDSVSVNGSGQAILSWSLATDPDVIEYVVLFNDPVSGWLPIDTVLVGVVMPYTWASSLADSRTEQFKVVSLDSCGNQSDAAAVVSHNTIHLNGDVNKCEGTIRLGWNYYEGFTAGVGGYNLYMREDAGGGFGNPVLLFTGSKDDSTYFYQNLQSGSEYCFYVRAYDSDTLITSTSNELCINADVPLKSRILYIAKVTNNFQRESIDIKAIVDGEADVSGYDIERSTERYGIYEVIGNVDKPKTLPYSIDFSDYSADPEIAYYYRLKAHNLCGGIDTVSLEAGNIVLSIIPNPNLTNSLSWPSYINWGGEVDRYDIYRSVENNFSYQLVGSNDGKDTTFVDNIENLGNSNGKFCYYVHAVETNNPLGLVDNNGQPFSSISNQKCANQKVKVYLPTAFRPSSDITANRTFGPTMRFEEIEEYEFYILNRWGATVFKTSDPKEFWDGNIDGQKAPLGVYVYYLKFSTLEDINQEERGTFTLIE